MTTKVKKRRTKHADWYYLVPLVFIIGVVPLIVRFIYIPLDGIAKRYWPYPYNSDLYNYWKVFWMEVAAVLLILLGCMKIRKIETKKLFYFIPIGIYAFFVILSYLMSEYKDIAFYGFPDRYEGMFVILTYLFITAATILLVDSEKHVKVLIGALITSATIIGLIGILQYFGHDFMKCDFIVKNFIIPEIYYKMGQVSMDFKNFGISSTLYNSNFVGSYMAMIFPLSIVFLILSNNKYSKIFIGIFSCLMLANLLGSRSRAGYIGTAMALVVIIIILRKYFVKYWLYIIISIVSIAPIIFAMHSRNIHDFTDQFILLRKDINNFFSIRKDRKRLKDILMSGNKVTIVTNDNPLTFFLDDNHELHFKDKSGNDLVQKKEQDDGDTIITFEDDLYRNYTFADHTACDVETMLQAMDNEGYTLFLKQSKDTLEVQKSGYSFSFKFTNHGMRFIDRAGHLQELKPVEKLNIAGKEKLGSGRLFVWSRTIPLLKKTIFTGFGPGTFAIYFPQTDFVGKLLEGGQLLLVEKPHNLYLDIGVSTGVISLLSFMVLIGMYFVSSFKLYMKNDFQNFYSIVGVGLFSAIVGYLMAGFFNDSVVPVAPVFWILFGLGIEMNLMLTDKGDKQSIVRTSAHKYTAPSSRNRKTPKA